MNGNYSYVPSTLCPLYFLLKLPPPSDSVSFYCAFGDSSMQNAERSLLLWICERLLLRCKKAIILFALLKTASVRHSILWC